MSPSEFSNAYKAHKQYVLNVAFLITKNRVEAEDITADVFITLWTYKRVINYEKLRSLLMVLTKHKSIDVSRARKRHIPIELVSVEYENGMNKSEIMLSSKEVLKIINKLPPQQKRLVTRSYWEGTPALEIAKNLNLGFSTVRNQLCTAIKNIKKDKYIIELLKDF